MLQPMAWGPYSHRRENYDLPVKNTQTETPPNCILFSHIYSSWKKLWHLWKRAASHDEIPCPLVTLQYLGWTKKPFKILTDHTNLQYWKSPKNLNCRTARWHADLQEYNYEIQHVPRKTNIPVDTLSQPPGADQGQDNNQNVVVIPPEKFTRIATTTPEITEETKCSLMTLVHDHYTTGHPGRDKTICKAKQHTSWEGMNMSQLVLCDNQVVDLQGE